MARIVNTVKVQTAQGEVEVTKTSTHRTYVEVSAVQLADGTQLVNTWHLTAEAGAKYRRSSTAAKLAAYEAGKYGQATWISLPVFVPEATTKTPAPVAQTVESAALQANGSGNCRCGCGELVSAMGKSLYRPGHDARHASAVAHDIASSASQYFERVTADADLGSQALVAKAHKQAERLLAKQAAKAAKQAK